MSIQTQRRDDFLATLDHLVTVSSKVAAATSGRGGVFTFPDQHKIAEGLFLNAWTHWEQFTRALLVDDLAEDPGGFVRKDVRKFRVKGAPRRIAERLLFHPDHPNRFVEWDFGLVRARADTFLSPNHRFSSALSRQGDLDDMKRIRNAIAHKSDRAWNSFRKLAKASPFSLAANQMKGLTVGRFLAAHQWGTKKVLLEAFDIHRTHAWNLVP